LLLGAVTALIHPYLMAMVMALWAASWLARWMTNGRRTGSLLAEGLIVIGGGAITLWQAGAFLIGRGLEREGFGYYRMNVNALLNPRVDAISHWSYVFPALGGVSSGEYEGFAFLGLGAILCVGLAAGITVVHRHRIRVALTSEWIPLGAVCVALTLMALSNEISIGSWVVRYPLPEGLTRAAGILRASGRLFWPVFYLIVFAGVAQIIRTFGRGAVIALLGILALLQVVDTAAGWRPDRERLSARHGRLLASPLHDAFWLQAATLYRTVHMVPWRSLRKDWPVFAIYADEHRMSTDSAYLTRVDQDRLALVEAQQIEQISRAEFEKTSLYIVDDGIAAALSGRIDRAVDLLKKIDGFWVVAPRWNALHKGAADSHARS
jgi:hypothetical protein